MSALTWPRSRDCALIPTPAPDGAVREAVLEGVRPWDEPSHLPSLLPPPLPRPAAHAHGAGRADSRTQNGGRNGCGHPQRNQQWRRQEALRSEKSEALAGALLRLLPEGLVGWGGLMPASGMEKGTTSLSPHGTGCPVPHRSGGKSEARPAGSPGVRPSQWLGRAAARAAGAGQSAGAAAGGGSRSWAPTGLAPVWRGMPWSGDALVEGCPRRGSAARFPRTLPRWRASATPYPEPPGSSGRRAVLECFRLPIAAAHCGPAAWAAPCAA